MLGSITPLGERGRRQVWAITVASFTVGSVGGGIAVGALAGLLGRLAGLEAAAWSVWVLVTLVAVGALLDWPAFPTGVPTTHRQVNEAWMGRYRGWVYGAGFGMQLGAGVVTVVSASAVYLAFVAAFLTASVTWGALVGGFFGLVRAVPVVGARGVRTPGALVRLTRRVRTLDRPFRLATPVAEAALAVAGVVLAATLTGRSL
jgi:hypothetical protein